MAALHGEELDALLSRVKQSPEDWERWLVLADWLTDRGDVRGKLVVLEHSLATAPSAEQRRELRRQIEALVAEHQSQWLAGLLVPEETALEWRSGFIVGVRPRWNADTLPFLGALLAHPTGRTLRTLNLGFDAVGTEGAAALAASENLRALTSLELAGNGLGDEGAAALATSPHLRALIKLDLHRNAIGAAGATALATSENLRTLNRLYLGYNHIGTAGAAALAASPHLRALTVLDLENNGIGAADAAALRASESLRGCVVRT